MKTIRSNKIKLARGSASLLGFFLAIAPGLPGLLFAEPAPAEPPVTAQPPAFQDERGREILAGFDAGRGEARLWYGGFLGFYAASTLASAAAAGTAREAASLRVPTLAMYDLGIDPRMVAFYAATGAENVRLHTLGRLALARDNTADGLILTALVDQAYARGEVIRRGKQDAIINGWSSFLGFAALALTPFPAATASDDLRALPSGSPGDTERALESGEAYLRESAETEAFGRSWISHGLTFFVSAAAGMATTVGYKRPVADGLVAFALNFLVGEIQIMTQPTRSIGDYDRYRARDGSGRTGSEAPDIRFYSVAVIPGGVAAVFVF